MAKKQQKPMKGVSCIDKNGVKYWYTRVDGRKTYCGIGDEGYKLAEAARAKHVARRYEDREIDRLTRSLKKSESAFQREVLRIYRKSGSPGGSGLEISDKVRVRPGGKMTGNAGADKSSCLWLVPRA